MDNSYFSESIADCGCKHYFVTKIKRKVLIFPHPPIDDCECKNYFVTKVLLFPFPVMKEEMTRDRFEAITKHLHFSDNVTSDPDDRLRKIRPVVDCFNETFKSVYVPDQIVTVDESLWRFKGRHHAVQYNPSKRARFGYKVYKLCDSLGRAAGYTSQYKVYMGQDRSDVPASMQVVIDLMGAAGLLDQGYELYLDNWYSSPLLFHYLQTRRTNSVGTVRLNRRSMPRDLVVRKKGDVDLRSSRTGMLALTWMDKKQVTMLSTIHKGSEMVSLPPDHRGEVRRKPKVVVDYNLGMKGVDLSDQMAVSYAVRRKCRKWYHTLFFCLVDTAVVNGFLVHKVLGGKLNHLEFRTQLVESLLTAHRARRPAPAPATAPRRPSSAESGHRLASLARRRRCKQCSKRKLRKESKFGCPECDVGLCSDRCFVAYHQE